jgi:hypothetical protein
VTVVQPEVVPAISRDPADDMFLAAANAGAADFLVTGDADLLVLNVYEQCFVQSSPLSRFWNSCRRPETRQVEPIASPGLRLCVSHSWEVRTQDLSTAHRIPTGYRRLNSNVLLHTASSSVGATDTVPTAPRN